MKAIETHYAGYRFRSRLEARWAVFFDALNLPWEYEKEGFELERGRYLPDFWLPTLGAWFEVKPNWPSDLEARKVAQLAAHARSTVFILIGHPIAHGRGDANPHESAHKYDSGGWADHCYAFCVCKDCHAVGIQFEARSDRMPCKGVRCPTSGGNNDRGHTGSHPRIVAAVNAARSARFEFGERPRLPCPF